MTVIEIPDERTAALRQKAALQGMSLKDWLAKTGGSGRSAQAPQK